MDERGRRRPYCVIFTPAAGDPAQARCGTFVAAAEEAARIVAQGIARDGGTARIEYVEPSGGSRTVIGRYLPPNT